MPDIQCPDSEVRIISRRLPLRTSESKDTSKLLILVWLWFRSPHNEVAAQMMRTSEPPHLVGKSNASAALADAARRIDRRIAGRSTFLLAGPDRLAGRRPGLRALVAFRGARHARARYALSPGRRRHGLPRPKGLDRSRDQQADEAACERPLKQLHWKSPSR